MSYRIARNLLQKSLVLTSEKCTFPHLSYCPKVLTETVVYNQMAKMIVPFSETETGKECEAVT
jgi:SUMO ligase MMS21 Smc5/6 complex component